MRRFVWIIALLACGSFAHQAKADSFRDFLRYWGIHYGPGVHAYNGYSSYTYVLPQAEEPSVAPKAPPHAYNPYQRAPQTFRPQQTPSRLR